jgi:hypothetical protein
MKRPLTVLSLSSSSLVHSSSSSSSSATELETELIELFLLSKLLLPIPTGPGASKLKLIAWHGGVEGGVSFSLFANVGASVERGEAAKGELRRGD